MVILITTILKETQIPKATIDSPVQILSIITTNDTPDLQQKCNAIDVISECHYTYIYDYTGVLKYTCNGSNKALPTTATAIDPK